MLVSILRHKLETMKVETGFRVSLSTFSDVRFVLILFSDAIRLSESTQPGKMQYYILNREELRCCHGVSTSWLLY